jgi:copper chaperone CopZ
MTAKTATYRVEGMSCTGCADSVRKLLAGQAGVSAAQVDFAAARATVTVADRFDAAAAEAALRRAGFTLTPVTEA